MYESKKSSTRKDPYKYQKSSYNRNFHNSTHFNHHKYIKYKQKYNHITPPADPDEELIFQKVFDSKNQQNRHTYKELDEITTTPISKENKFDNKENFSLNSNLDNMKTKMRTNDANVNSDINSNNIMINNNYIRNDSEEFLIEEKEEKKEPILKNDILNEINNLNNINFYNNDNNNINKINNINFNVENVINDLLKKNNECIFASNEKESPHIDHKKNIYKTPQPFKANSTSSINLSSNDLKEAYYVPRKLSAIYDMCATQQPNNFFERKHNSLNNFNFLTTIQKPSISLSSKQNNNANNNLGISNNININYFQNNNNNNFIPFNYSNNSINNFNISPSPNIPPFNLFEPNNLNVNNIPNLSQCLNTNNNNSHHNINKNPFHNMMPKMELNQCILKTQINNNTLFEKDKENTDILEINVKIKENKTLTFKIRRYDDMFRTVKIFCEINKLDIKLIRPFIIYIIKALNSIYGIYNLKLKKDEINFLKELKNKYYKEDEKDNEDNEDDEESDLNDEEKNINNDDIENEEDENEKYEKDYESKVD